MLSRNAVFMFLLLCAAGCSENSSPTAPFVRPPGPVAIYGVVKSPTGGCLEGAVIELLDGPRAGERLSQTDSACADVDYSDYVQAFVFEDLPRNSAITVRASRTGFYSQEAVWEPKVCCTTEGALRITLQPTSASP